MQGTSHAGTRPGNASQNQTNSVSVASSPIRGSNQARPRNSEGTGTYADVVASGSRMAVGVGSGTGRRGRGRGGVRGGHRGTSGSMRGHRGTNGTYSVTHVSRRNF